MNLLTFVIGIALPSLAGWLTLDALEARTSVLGKIEKWIVGFLLGMTLMTFVAFLLHTSTGLLFTLPTFLIAHVMLIAPLGALWFKRRSTVIPSSSLWSSERTEGWKWTLRALTIWVALQIVALGSLLLLMPSFFDDTLDNWNMRAKIFFYGGTMEQTFGSGIGSYPPSVPLAKTWLATLADGWSEGLVNSLHGLWFLAALGIVFFVLRRSLSRQWSLFGALLLGSLPLYMMQGLNAYADVFLSAHLLAAVGMLYLALTERAHGRALCFLRIAAFAIALVPFTKNEGWVLYFPILVLLYGCSLAWLWKSKVITLHQVLVTGLTALALWIAIAGPWIGFKVLHGLPFGNAKGLDTSFAWHPGVLLAILVNTFFEANWIFLFPLLIGLLIVRRRSILTSPLLLLAAFFMIPYGVQLYAYFFTGLAQEAILQTGYARGVIHLVPVMVLLTTLLLHDWIFAQPLPVRQAGATRNS